MELDILLLEIHDSLVGLHLLESSNFARPFGRLVVASPPFPVAANENRTMARVSCESLLSFLFYRSSVG